MKPGLQQASGGDTNVRYRDAGTGFLSPQLQLPGLNDREDGQPSAGGGQENNKPKPLLQSNIPAAPTISLPKGGGAVRGIGEKFNVNPNTGTGSLVLPVKTSPGRSGLQPSLSLSYDSASGNSEFGLGWRLSGVDAITRKTSKGLPRYNDRGSDQEADVFLLAGAEDLVPLWKTDSHGKVVLDSNGQPTNDERSEDGFIVRAYAPRIMTIFNRIERWVSATDRDDIHWRVISPDNITTIFGLSDACRIYDPGAAADGSNRRIFSWLQSETYDPFGNAMVFSYKREDSANINNLCAHEANRSDISRRVNLYLKSIRYGNTVPNRDLATWEAFSALSLPQDARTWKYTVMLDYGEHSLLNPKLDDSGIWPCRQDPFSRHNSGFEIRTYRLCRRILMFHHFDELGTEDYLVSSLDLTYDESPTVAYLVAAEQAGYSGSQGQGQTPFRKSLPPVDLDYCRFPSDDDLKSLTVENLDTDSSINLPIGLDEKTYRWVDLDGEGLSGILSFYQNSWYYKRNTSASNFVNTANDHGGENDKLVARLGPLETVSPGPFLAASSLDMQFGDINGNGKLDVISRAAGQWGYFERDADEALKWTEFRPFRTFPSTKTGPGVQFIDLTGDGLADVLLYNDQVYTWYESRGSDGFSAPESIRQDWDETKGPVCVFADSQQTILLADMSGDGMTDICRVRNGDCCYWPNLGYGHFGSQVNLDNGPWSDYYGQFDHTRIRIADVDGSGTSDILYLTNDGVDIYLNQSGNSFSERKHVFLPGIDNTSIFNVVDLLGNGTQCFVWSSPLPSNGQSSLRYVDIFGNKKPHLLNQVANNLGSETRVHYAPSTKFYLQDKQNGRPWITSLHFPVQCVERVETVDAVSGNEFSSSYRYSHGFYDGVEREFRGFARVEQIDASSFLPVGSASAWDVPPVHTVTWFDTGAYFNRSTTAEILSREYFGSGSSASVGLDSTQIPAECVEGVQQLEACRALKGKVLRVEIYSDDNSTAKSHLPYSVQASNFTIVANQVLQDAHNHGIYFVHARESISCSYERVLQDPRITHQMVLQVDSFGHVLKELKIAYGRMKGQSPLDTEDAVKQEKTVVIYQESQFTNSLGGKQYRIPAPYGAQQYELGGLEPTNNPRGRFVYGDVTANSFDMILSLPEVPFESERQASGTPYRRLLQSERSFYKADNLSGLLPAGVLEPLGLPGSYHKLVFTPGLFGKLFTQTMADGSQLSLLSTSEALGENGYVDLDGTGHLWTASVTVSYSDSPSPVTAAQEVTEAKGGFFIPKTFTDIFGNPYRATYDRYHLFPVTSRDAVGNTVTTTVDYRALQPSNMIDPNGNRSVAAYDALGLVAGVAISGKPSDGIGDTLDTNFDADLSKDRLDSFIADPSPSMVASLLGNATSRIISDLWRWKNSQTPIYSVALSRDTHVNFPLPPGGPLFQIQITYSDGFGRVIQRKSRTKSGPVSEGGPVVNDRWIGTGWTIFNNKGKPVKQFEPFLDTSAAYHNEMIVGVSSTLLYDPLDRPVAIIHPDHTVEKTVFTPWSRQEFDANDNVLLPDPRQDPDVGHLFSSFPEEEMLPSWYQARRSGGMGREEQDAAAKTVPHANTPKSTHLDSLGRPFMVQTLTGSETIKITTDLDILGNPRLVRDGLLRISQVSDFDMCQRQVRIAALDSGYVVDFLDGADQKSMSWNNRDFRFRFEYDKLRRPTKSWWRDQGATAEVLTSQVQYGEEYQSSGSDSAASRNLRTRVWKVLDQSGVVINSDYNWDGSLTQSTRKFATEYKQVFDVAINMSLEDEEHITRNTFDAQHRPIRSVAPDGTVSTRVYSQSGQLDDMFVNTKGELDPNSDPSSWTAVVKDIQHNAKGQLVSMSYGNGAKMTRTYDELTFRLRQLRTVSPDGGAVQDLRYTYDSVGNITNVRDASQQTVFFRNTVVDPSADYTYDAIYRLISGSGREHLGQTNGRPDAPTVPSGLDNTHNSSSLDAGDGNVMARFKESYSYDLAGNLLRIRHESSDPQTPGWTRTFTYNEPSLLEPGRVSNRLSQTSVGSTAEVYRYEGNSGRTGNMSSMPHLPLMIWDFADQLKATSKQIVGQGNGKVPETTYYVYSKDGRRVRKVTESQTGPNSQTTPTRLQERIYLGDYEIFRKYPPSPNPTEGPPSLALERTVFHANTDYGHLADICTRTVGSDDGLLHQIRFQLHNHLGSATLELSDTGQLLSYEEYFPFGASSYKMTAGQTGTAKRFRYSGKELDAENGLYYFGARYYAAWIGRWTAADPVIRPGGSRYDFAADNPVRLVDPDGRDPKPAGSEAKPSEPEKPKTPTFAPGQADPIFRLPVPAEAGRFPSQTTWTPGEKVEPSPKLLGVELKFTSGNEKVQGAITVSAETPFKLSDWPALPEFKTGTLKLSEDFQLKLAPFAVGTFGVAATQDLSTTTGKGENKMKLEISGGLQLMMPGNWELDITGKAGRTVSDQTPGPGVDPTKIDWSAGITAILPRHLSTNPVALGLLFSGAPASPFAPVPDAAHPPGGPTGGGFSAVLSVSVGFSWPGEAGKTPIRDADILKTETGKRLVGWAEEKIPGARQGLDVGVEKVVPGVTGTELPRIIGLGAK